MEKKATIVDVAEKARISKSTVSNYLNGKFESMAPETKSVIEKVIKELHYTPSLSARRLSAKAKSKTICLIIPGYLASINDSQYYPSVFTAIGNVAEEVGYKVLIYARNSNDIGNEMEYLKSLASSLVDGFLIFDLKDGDYYFQEFKKLKIPYVCVGKTFGYSDYHYVASDHQKALRKAMDHLVRLGHKKIAILSDNYKSVVETHRYKEYLKCLKDNNIPFHKDYYVLISREASGVSTYEKFQTLIDNLNGPTAYIVISTYLYPFLKAIRKRQLKIPMDVSVVLIDYYGNQNPERMNFTRVESKVEVVSQLAFKKLIDTIYHPDQVFESKLVELDFVIGDTTRALS